MKKIILYLAGIVSLIFLLVACDSSSSPSTTSGSQGTALNNRDVTISGRLTYDFVPHSSSGALNYNDERQEPIRGVVVQLLDDQDRIADTTQSDNEGNYVLEASANTRYRVRVRAEMVKAPVSTDPNDLSWDVKVTDNTDSNALYVLDGSLVDSGAQNSVRNLRAESGWTSVAYTETRSAGPFAILDSTYQLLTALEAEDFSAQLPPMEFRWSIDNRPNRGNLTEGDIATSFYDNSQRAVYLLGAANNDTDEYDRSVVQHEFGHYLENVLARTNSIGGPHTGSDILDMRVAFGEGFANALTGLASQTGYYEDSSRTAQQGGFRFSVEDLGDNLGWYSEESVANIIYDLADDTTEAGDDIQLDLATIMRVLESDTYVNNTALTSIYLFLDALKVSTDTSTDILVDALAQSHNISGSDAFGTGETNDGGVVTALPVYNALITGESIELCSIADDATIFNKLGVRRFVRFTLPDPGMYTVDVQKTARTTGSKDPDAVLFFNGRAIQRLDSEQVDRETASLSLDPGDYVLEVYDFNNLQDSRPATACFDVSVTEEN